MTHLDWPFFEARHRQLQAELESWASVHVSQDAHADVDAACRELVARLGHAGWLNHAVGDTIDTRAVCLIRETLARHSGLADFAFAMQGLGAGAISLAGTSDQKDRYLGRVSRGEAVAAIALSEPDAGSDVAAMRLDARLDGDHVALNG